ncbi:MAG: phenylacetate-CoA oxygenase subunit PaaJ [Ignavibacteriales bacterium]|nr:phenylacetate-CoA oxygenase subunit PaaJ [Ignavibacteriales bacterium]
MASSWSQRKDKFMPLEQRQVHNVAEAKAWDVLQSVQDPEIPALTLVDLNVIRHVKANDQGVEVEMTPTFMGCPALDRMKEDIRIRLQEAGFKNVRVNVNLTVPWSTDMLIESSKEKLQKFGIAPPPVLQESLPATLLLPVQCPFCNSTETRLESEFGSTLCKQLYYCDSCRQSFERFKPL